MGFWSPLAATKNPKKKNPLQKLQRIFNFKSHPSVVWQP
jgi:hypothetical protein